MTVRNTVLELISNKQIQDGKRVTVGQVAREAGIERQTLYNWVNNPVMERIDADTLEKICRYFNVGIEVVLRIESQPN